MRTGQKEMSRYVMPFYTMLHPINGFDELRYRKKNSLRMSLLFFLVFVLLGVVEQQFTGPQITMADKDAVDLVQSLLLRFAVVFLFVLANWAFCVLVDGKAGFADIWVITTYALLPYMACGYLRVLLSNVLAADESVFLTFLTGLGVLWSFLLLMTAFTTFHEFELSKALLAFVITLIGMLLIVFLLFLLYSLFQQLLDTVLTLINEITFRVRLNG